MAFFLFTIISFSNPKIPPFVFYTKNSFIFSPIFFATFPSSTSHFPLPFLFSIILFIKFSISSLNHELKQKQISLLTQHEKLSCLLLILWIISTRFSSSFFSKQNAKKISTVFFGCFSSPFYFSILSNCV